MVHAPHHLTPSTTLHWHSYFMKEEMGDESRSAHQAHTARSEVVPGYDPRAIWLEAKPVFGVPGWHLIYIDNREATKVKVPPPCLLQGVAHCGQGTPL